MSLWKMIFDSVLAWLLRAIGGSMTPLQVEAELTKLASASSEKLDWRNSIVDLLKLLQLDSGFAARRVLARDFGYAGTAADGSAEKNIWLHKEVMRRLAEGTIVFPIR